jgi:hypothetical protein
MPILCPLYLPAGKTNKYVCSSKWRATHFGGQTANSELRVLTLLALSCNFVAGEALLVWQDNLMTGNEVRMSSVCVTDGRHLDI